MLAMNYRGPYRVRTVQKAIPEILHPEDAIAYEEVSKALKVLGGWYFCVGEFDKEVKKARKRLK